MSDGQEIVKTENGRPVAEVRPPRSPREELTGSLFGFCRDIIELPEGFDFDKESVWADYEEIGEEVLASWERQEPDLVESLRESLQESAEGNLLPLRDHI